MAYLSERLDEVLMELREPGVHQDPNALEEGMKILRELRKQFLSRSRQALQQGRSPEADPPNLIPFDPRRP